MPKNVPFDKQLKAAEQMAAGISRKAIEHTLNLRQDVLTRIKQDIPLFCYKRGKEPETD